MLILGLNDSNSAAAIIKNGELVAAVREERFSRDKFDDTFPSKAVEYCLKEAGVDSIRDVDQVVFAWNPGHEIEPHDSSAAIRYHKHLLHYIPNNLLALVKGDKKNKKIVSIDENLRFFDGKEMKIHFAPHHSCHAASAFFVSPFEEAAILTIDAHGDDITTQLFHGKGNNIEEKGKTSFPHSVGHVYAALTQYLGFKANSDEWKVMGLAPYGDPEKYYKEFESIIDFDRNKGELRFDLNYFTYYIWSPRRYSNQLIELLGPERYKDDEISDRHRDIAASFQKRVENVIIEMCVFLYKKTGSKNLCLAGGVAMNSRMNGRILSEGPFSKVWVQPSADDAGCSIGACFYYWNQVLRKKRVFQMEHDYWGPHFTNDEIESVLKDSLLSYTRYEDIEVVTADLIAKGNIVGWFQGRMEMGQRALGNRSLIADPRDASMKDKINAAVKHRESFRPFAPSILEEYANEYFDTDHENPFMQMIFQVKLEKRKEIPAVTHCDGSGRSQFVSKKTNVRYWNLINEFRKITGVPVILNTSFNDNDEPIVCTPKDAIRCFAGTGIDHVVIGDYLISKQTV
jgi:carbamoyltransferase